MAQRTRFAIPVDGELIRLLTEQNRLLRQLSGLGPVLPVQIDKGVDRSLVERLESFGGRLQRFKEALGFGVAESDEVAGGQAHGVVNSYMKIALENPENSPVILIPTRVLFTVSVAARWIIERPTKPSTLVGAQLFPAAVRYAGGHDSNAKVRVVNAAAEPGRPWLLSGKVVANSTIDLDVGTVLVPNSSELFDLFLPATTDTYHMALEWFEIPLGY